MKLVSPRLYQRQADGAYFARLVLRGRQTWRKLKAVKLRPAIAELANTNWEAPAGTFTELADLYVAAGCPNRKLERREGFFVIAERARCTRLKEYFHRQPAAALRLVDLPRYKDWRIRRITRGTGERTVDLELCTLSNVLSYGVNTGQLDFNYVARGRPCYRQARDIRHSRAVAPASADVIHALAAHFFEEQRSQVFGWQALFAAFTGCRTSELLRLRLDAGRPEEAGFVSGGLLFLGYRSKHGVDPWVTIGSEFAEMFAAFRAWHNSLYPESAWYFPGRAPGRPVDASAFRGVAFECRGVESGLQFDGALDIRLHRPGGVLAEWRVPVVISVQTHADAHCSRSGADWQTRGCDSAAWPRAARPAAERPAPTRRSGT